MPTTEQLDAMWLHDFYFGREVYADTPNVRGSAYIGRTKGWLETEHEDEQRRNRWYSIHKKQKSDTFRYY